MPAHKSPDDLLRDTWEAVRQIGSAKGAARDLGIPETTLKSRLDLCFSRLGLPDPRKGIYFEAPPLPSKDRSLDEILAHRRRESERAVEYEDGINLIPVQINTPGPIGLMVFGDPHIDNPGSDWNLFEGHLKIAADRPQYVFAGNIGDVRDNWVGRLTRLYADQTITARESWKLAEHVFVGSGVQWTWLSRGNHDCWAQDNDPLDWISRASGIGVDRHFGLRIAFRHPCGSETRLHARHDFEGNSIYNPLHALKREVLHGHRDHIIVAGHRHIGADAGDVNGDGRAFQMVRVSSYKVSDSYRHQIGAHAKPIHPAAMIIVDPSLPETSRARAWCAPTVEEGADYLDWKRKRWEAEHGRSQTDLGGRKAKAKVQSGRSGSTPVRRKDSRDSNLRRP